MTNRFENIKNDLSSKYKILILLYLNNVLRKNKLILLKLKLIF
jgi:hypothetical protein